MRNTIKFWTMALGLLLLFVAAAPAVSQSENVALRACSEAELAEVEDIVGNFARDMETALPTAESILELNTVFSRYSFRLPDCVIGRATETNYRIVLLWLFTNAVLYEDGRSEELSDWQGFIPSLGEEFWNSAEHLALGLSNNSELVSPVTTASPSSDRSEMFEVVVDGTSNVNLRSCAGTQCEIVGTAAGSSVLRVIDTEEAADGDWYRVETAAGEAYIATWLTTRGPDTIIDTSEPYFDPMTGCTVAFNTRRGDLDVVVILTGSGLNEITADVYRPNQNIPVSVDAQYDKTFIDTGEPYIHQFYRWNEYWPTGLYQLEIEYGGEVSRMGWELTESAEHSIYVLCE